jgi:hypothetical protein
VLGSRLAAFPEWLFGDANAKVPSRHGAVYPTMIHGGRCEQSLLYKEERPLISWQNLGAGQARMSSQGPDGHDIDDGGTQQRMHLALLVYLECS